MIEVNIVWSSRLARQLDSLNVQDALSKGLRIAMIGIESNVKRETPVDTGLLRNSFETRFPSKLTGVLNNFRDYAIYIQYWTKYIKARDFLGKWVAASKLLVENVFSKQIDLLLRTLD